MSLKYGENLKLEIFGSSHGPNVGMKLSGLPKGIKIDLEKVQEFLNRRAPGTKNWSTSRKEADIPSFTSGISPDGFLDGNTICATIENRDVRESDYNSLKNLPRPGHADYTAVLKYGKNYSETGGGQFSGRMTAPLCIAGAICKQVCESRGMVIFSRIVSIGNICDEGELVASTATKGFPTVSDSAGDKMRKLIMEKKIQRDSIGGVIECSVVNCPGGLGGPLFEGMETRISSIVFAVPGVKAVEFGLGFSSTSMSGSENNDEFFIENDKILTKTNNCGGILGGITNGMPITFRVGFKPTPSIGKPQKTVNLETLEETIIEINGRHDPCIVPRAVPCIEACAAIAICDVMLEATKRKPHNDFNNKQTLQSYREEIDRIDEEIVRLLEERMAVSEDIGLFKKENSLPVFDKEREESKLKEIEEQVKYKKSQIASVYRTIFAESRKCQK